MSEIPGLDPPASHGVRAALGWLELGNAEEACMELRALPADVAAHPQVLEVWWLVHTQARNWAEALGVAEHEMVRDPRTPSAWLHRAYALRRLPGGGLQAAWDALRPAADLFLDEPVIPFNLACYACQLGRLDQAREWLTAAQRIWGTERLRDMALADPDLKPLWSELRATSAT